MSEQKKRNLNFLLKKDCGLSYRVLNELAQIDTFYNRIQQYVDASVNIDNNVVFDIISDIYLQLGPKRIKKSDYVPVSENDSWDIYRHKYGVLRSAYVTMKKHMERSDTPNG